VVCRHLHLPLANSDQQQAGQKRQQHAPPLCPLDLISPQRPLTVITTLKVLLRYAYKTLELNDCQAVQGGQVLLDLDRRLGEDL
jgi:hypothetical protein